MAWGISPRKTVTIPLGDYSADHYLTLLYHAFNNLGWRIGYFNRDGIIGYTPLSWESYAEEVSVRIVNNYAIVKSECVGYQFFFNDYGKNAKNLELLLNGEIEYVEYHLKDTLHETTQDLIDSIPDNQFINLEDPPMGYKEKLRSFSLAFHPKTDYFITPLLVLTNIAVYIFTFVFLIAMIVVFAVKAQQQHSHRYLFDNIEEIYLSLGFSSRTQVLSGQVWRLLTNTFLHFSLLHIAGNMVVLIYIGSLLESKLGRWNYLFLYLLTGICASITSVVWRDQGIAAGASGAIFGLFGIFLALLSTKFYEPNARRALLISTALFVGYIIIPKGSRVDHAAHFGGLVSGYLFGWIAYLDLKNQKQKLTAVYAAAITVIFTGACIWLAPVYQFKELKQLSAKTERLSDELRLDFYGNYTNQRDSLMMVFTHKALPKMDTLKQIGKQMQQLVLPKKEKQVADIKSKIIFEECKLYALIYKEYRDKDQVKYRDEINQTTQTINDLRMEWGKVENKDDED
jgi:rhomboid protease GluP